jgi:hypothetical protein
VCQHRRRQCHLPAAELVPADSDGVHQDNQISRQRQCTQATKGGAGTGVIGMAQGPVQSNLLRERRL